MEPTSKLSEVMLSRSPLLVKKENKNNVFNPNKETIPLNVHVIYPHKTSLTKRNLASYHDRSGANFSARIAAFNANSSRITKSAVLRY